MNHDILFPIYVRSGPSPDEYKAGFINLQGHTVIDANFQDATPLNEGLASAKIDGRWGSINSSGNLLIPYSHSEALRFCQGRAQFYGANSRVGVLSNDGNVVVPPKYRTISEYSDSLACVCNGETYGFIDLMGTEVIPPFFEEARQFVDGLAPVQLGGKWGYIDKGASFVIPAKFDSARNFSEGLARVSIDGRWGYIDRQGDYAIPPEFATCLDFRESLAPAAIVTRGPLGYIDKTGEFVIPPKYGFANYFSEDLASASAPNETRFRFLSRTGEPAFDGEFLGTGDFDHRRCLVSTMETIAYIDQTGQRIWEGPYVTKL